MLLSHSRIQTYLAYGVYCIDRILCNHPLMQFASFQAAPSGNQLFALWSNPLTKPAQKQAHTNTQSSFYLCLDVLKHLNVKCLGIHTGISIGMEITNIQ